MKVEDQWSFGGLEEQDQEKLFDPKRLADDDSLFFDLDGFHIHHKIRRDDEEEEEEEEEDHQQRKRTGMELPMILFHGFGASVFSWEQVMKPLARITGSNVLAFDRPAFGLTSRILSPEFSWPNPYSTSFSVLATFSFMDMLGCDKAILMGHSAGCLVAANAYLEAPESIAALILVAPAIPAPFTSQNKLSEIIMKEESDFEPARGAGILTNILSLLMILAWPFKQLLKGAKGLLFSLYTIILSEVLHSSLAVVLVRNFMTMFGVAIVRHGWHDKSKVTQQVIDGYTKPLKARDWEMALLEYILAILKDLIPGSTPPLNKRLREIKCPVLVITGDDDRIVPPWNSERVAAAIPGSTLEVIRNCGHLPHEEKVEDFMLVVNKFLQANLKNS